MSSRAARFYAGLFLFTAVHGPLALAQPSGLSPAYLSEFPPVERILRDYQAADPRERAARQLGALLQMNHIIDDLSEGRAARNQYTYDETVKLTEYKRAQLEIRDTLQDKTASAARGYDSDLGFRQELLKRYFSPAFQARWMGAASRTVAAAVAASQRPAPQPVPPAKPTVGPADPGIAKARAANVDTKVFGIPLGEPLSMPKCEIGLFGSPAAAPCYSGSEEMTKLLGDLLGTDLGTPGDERVTVWVADSSCPTWMSSCSFTATIQNGRFTAADVQTKGRDVEKTVGAELRGKYGTRASVQQRFITPNNGSAQFTVYDLDWELPGLHVEYKVVDSTINDGHLRIETERLYADRKAREAEAAKPKL